MFNIEQYLNKIAEGDLTITKKLCLADHIQEMAKGVKRIAAGLADRISFA
ncbi:MAG: hypothetical protein PHV77_02290 [Candidatus Omnitrophica bacterium]|jgi:hypothetical protein|nr:hypothetical protein [Candidatus Omnitrophota bacterium]